MNNEEQLKDVFNVTKIMESGGDAFMGPIAPIKLMLSEDCECNNEGEIETKSIVEYNSTDEKCKDLMNNEKNKNKGIKRECDSSTAMQDGIKKKEKKDDSLEKMIKDEEMECLVEEEEENKNEKIEKEEEEQNDEKRKKKKSTEKVELKLDKNIYGKIYSLILKNQSMKINKRVDIEHNDFNSPEEYFISNIFHYRNDNLVCGEAPPPLKNYYLMLLFKVILSYFIKQEEKDIKENLPESEENSNKENKESKPKPENCMKKMKKAMRDEEAMYQLLLLYYYAYAYHNYYYETGNIPEDLKNNYEIEMLTDWNKIFKMGDISLHKRMKKQKDNKDKVKTIKNILKNEVMEVDTFASLLKIPDSILDAIIRADMNGMLNVNDDLFSSVVSTCGLVNLTLFIYNLLVFGHNRLNIKNNNIDFKII